jgi:hypothetical protein
MNDMTDERIAARIDQLAAYGYGTWSVYQTLLAEGYCEGLEQWQRERVYEMAREAVDDRPRNARRNA